MKKEILLCTESICDVRIRGIKGLKCVLKLNIKKGNRHIVIVTHSVFNKMLVYYLLNIKVDWTLSLGEHYHILYHNNTCINVLDFKLTKDKYYDLRNLLTPIILGINDHFLDEYTDKVNEYNVKNWLKLN